MLRRGNTQDALGAAKCKLRFLLILKKIQILT